ncbi:uncharacterized protein EI97DRAFT_280659 [Westerdykella ornata]|uniref:Uncharacterized protein n=1 Tax=Westerdykella ornata TaxID=318751 RepID=A0A6A6JQM9_WESOR|nr:uncharacterized protein EI97DRAFT_280659 [Westerdykella ornata]KAF2277996.1 hypothetical protein EI97DRAFT_280659 [Westerdykella ornata]
MSFGIAGRRREASPSNSLSKGCFSYLSIACGQGYLPNATLSWYSILFLSLLKKPNTTGLRYLRIPVPACLLACLPACLLACFSLRRSQKENILHTVLCCNSDDSALPAYFREKPISKRKREEKRTAPVSGVSLESGVFLTSSMTISCRARLTSTDSPLGSFGFPFLVPDAAGAIVLNR